MDPRQKKYLFYILISMSFAVLFLKLADLQIMERKKYLQHSQRNRVRRIALQPNRGVVYDRNGVVLVENVPSYSVSAIPYEMMQSAEPVNLLSSILNMPHSEIIEKVKRGTGLFNPVKLARDVDFDILVKIEEKKLDLPGIIYNIEPKRFYPTSIKAPHLFGYIGEITKAELLDHNNSGIETGSIIGKKGIEKIYDSYLRGETGVNFYEVDALGREVRDIDLEGEHPPLPGDELYLTLDADVQTLAEQLLADKKGGLVLVDVRDGGILAIVSKPDYDPDIFSGVMTHDLWRNLVNNPDRPLYDRMVQSTFPPGSTFKLVLAVAALETGLWNPSMTSVCNGQIRLGRRVFNCWKKDGHGRVDLLGAIKGSCNVYFYRLMPVIGIDNWANFAAKFGFGKLTEVDLFGENNGNLPDRKYLDKVYGKNGWTTGMLYNLAIGQGDLLVTSLQMVQLVAMLANFGEYAQPHILRKIYDMGKNEYVSAKPIKKHVEGISKETYDIIRQGMYMVVNEQGGTGRASFVQNFRVCGKTGTAQNPHGDAHAWYIGFAPFDNPEVAICVFLENGGSGGGQAAPIARQIFARYYEKYHKNFATAGNTLSVGAQN